MLTISEGMVLQKTLNQRKNDLQRVRDANLVDTRRWDILQSGQEKERTEITAHYDPKVVDAKITEIETALYKLDAAIKKANAISKINIEIDLDKLLAPIQ